jgi:hypothetical protein
MDHNSQSERLATVETEVGSIRQDITHIKTTVDALAKAQQASQATNWPLVISVMTAAGMLLGGLFVTSSLSQENMALKSKLDVMAYIQPVVVSAENSRSDRAALHSKVDENTEKVSELAGRVDSNFAAFKSSIAEAEAQFKNVGTTANLRHAENQKMFSLLWEKVFGSQLPDIEYWPQAHREIVP